MAPFPFWFDSILYSRQFLNNDFYLISLHSQLYSCRTIFSHSHECWSLTDGSHIQIFLHGNILVFWGINSNDKMVFLIIEIYYYNESDNTYTKLLSFVKGIFPISEDSNTYIIEYSDKYFLAYLKYSLPKLKIFFVPSTSKIYHYLIDVFIGNWLRWALFTSWEKERWNFHL